jgi:hypothetical protein
MENRTATRLFGFFFSPARGQRPIMIVLGSGLQADFF